MPVPVLLPFIIVFRIGKNNHLVRLGSVNVSIIVRNPGSIGLAAGATAARTSGTNCNGG